MAVAGQSTGYQYTVSTFLKGLQDIDWIHLAGAGHFHDLDGRRIIKTHRACQVCSGVGTVMTAECDDVRRKCCVHDSSIFPSILKQKGMYFFQRLVICAVTDLDRLGRTLRGAGAAAMADCRFDKCCSDDAAYTVQFAGDPGNVIRADPDTGQAANTFAGINLGHPGIGKDLILGEQSGSS